MPACTVNVVLRQCGSGTGFDAEVPPAKAAAGATPGLPFCSTAAGLAAVRAAVKAEKAARGMLAEEEERTDGELNWRQRANLASKLATQKKPRRRYKHYSGWSHVAQATWLRISRVSKKKWLGRWLVGARGASLGGPYGAANAHCCVAVDESRSSLAACCVSFYQIVCLSVCPWTAPRR